MVEVLFFSLLREKLGHKRISLEYAGDVYGLLEELERRGIPIRKYVLDGEEVKKGYIVLVNGKNIVHLEGLSTRVRDGDRISIFPPAGGG